MPPLKNKYTQEDRGIQNRPRPHTHHRAHTRRESIKGASLAPSEDKSPPPSRSLKRTNQTSFLKMSTGLSACLVLVVLCTSSWGLPFPSRLGERERRSPSEEAHALGEPHLRHRRSAPQLQALTPSQEDADLSELLARLMSSRKGGSVRRNSPVNGRNGVGHRIADRDYTGWMDFGRRSADEYEYSS
ncbi:cholecystokinin-like [Stigmatopora argus]